MAVRNSCEQELPDRLRSSTSSNADGRLDQIKVMDMAAGFAAVQDPKSFSSTGSHKSLMEETRRVPNCKQANNVRTSTASSNNKP